MDSKIVTHIETLIRQGQGATARYLLQKIRPSEVGRSLRLPLSNFARRLALYSKALKLLNPIIYPKGLLESEATDEEKMSYASTLSRIGARAEAEELFAQINPQLIPEVWLQRGLHLFSFWQYSQAAPFIKKYLKTEQDPYRKLVGKTNLASCLLFLGNQDEARELLTQIKTTAEKNKYHLLLGNALEMLAQEAIQRKAYVEANKFLEDSINYLSGFGSDYLFYAKKWSAVVELTKNGPQQSILLSLSDLYQEAMTHHQWETARDIEYHLAVHTKQKALVKKVYFGTPYKEYRKRLINNIGGDEIKDDTFTWHVKPRSSGSDVPLYDIVSGSWNNDASQRLNSTLRKLMATLTVDFYRPALIGQINESVFPGEYYNPDSTPKKIHELVRRTRMWFAHNGVEPIISASQRQFRIDLDTPACFRVPQHRHPLGDKSIQLVQLKNLFPYQHFHRRDVVSTLGISKSQAHRLLKWASESQAVYVSGGGRETTYRFAA